MRARACDQQGPMLREATGPCGDLTQLQTLGKQEEGAVCEDLLSRDRIRLGNMGSSALVEVGG